MLIVYITKGLPGSGKSTWAKEKQNQNPNAYKRINKDELRGMLDNGYHSNDAERYILKVRDTLIKMALLEGKHVIVDDTNLAPKHEARIRQVVENRATVEIVDFTSVSLEECIKRDLGRPYRVGEAVIKRMYNKYLAPKCEEVKYDPNLPEVIICDLDGTLCLLNGRDPHNASTCENDLPNKVVVDIILNEYSNVILVSGREDKYRDQTENWLHREIGGWKGLYMRPSGDFRKDAVIKKEIYENHIKGKYNVKFVLDDRNQVVELWRSLGLVCLQVADGDF